LVGRPFSDFTHFHPSKQASLMTSFFRPLDKPTRATPAQSPPILQHAAEKVCTADEIFMGYLSDASASDGDLSDEKETNEDIDRANAAHVTRATPLIPPLKRRKLSVPARVARQLKKETREKEQSDALVDIQKVIRSKRAVFAAGSTGLQSYRARAIESYLQMVVVNKRGCIEASERAAEAQGFAPKWGGRMVRVWAGRWLRARELPESMRGRNVKSFSVLQDPAIRAELCSYLRSNKWAIDPEKLAAFSQHNMITPASEQYLSHIVEIEMPRGLKQYLDVELFPRIQLKVSRGVSLATARRWLRQEGFRYTEHKKSLYFDGHERPDVVKYRQEVFLPTMKEHKRRLVQFVVGDVAKEVTVPPTNYVERRLVLVAHDEMTAQANDGQKKSWVSNGEHALKKKGVGRGIHQSDVICSTVGWLPEASQTLEYGKNYDGYWTGELFVKQVQ
jgi:hypothetical protein